ncbi:MAG TPA: NADH-quinone oxidoreductase subunit N [Candidatus Krumholzibacteria bacterium]|nr:NADH-quinone oxidoreductase subunit N [Candidatus Krumholzibacteria bacterium]
MSFEFAWHPDAWLLVAPMLVVCGTALVILVGDLFLPNVRWTIPALAGLALAAALALARWNQPLAAAEAALNGALRLDAFAIFLQVAILACAGLSLLGAQAYHERAGTGRAEFFVLVLFATVGMMVLVASSDLITMFLGLELLSFPTYVLCGFLRQQIKSNEAALKYFVLGSFASSVFLYGIALVWGASGSTQLAEIAQAPESPLLYLGALLVATGFLFKIGAVPFHMWVPDVYEGAPTPVTMLMATAVKIAAFGALVRTLLVTTLYQTLPLGTILWWCAILTMTVGNMSALTQPNIKRMLAFSSVAHAGYMLVGLAAVATTGWPAGASAVLYYLLAYAAMNIGAFTVVTLLGRRAEGELQFDRDWSGVARRHPGLGVAMALFMIALGGLPPTAGFFGKYSLFRAALDAGLVSLVVIAVLNSLVSVYYYLRVIVAMYMKAEREAPPVLLDALAPRVHAFDGPGAMAAPDVVAPPPAPRLAEARPWGAFLAVAVCAVLTLWLGIGPSLGGLPGLSQVMAWAEAAVESLR